MTTNDVIQFSTIAKKNLADRLRDGSTLEYHPLFAPQSADIIAFYKYSDFVQFKNRLTVKYNWNLYANLDKDTLTITIDSDDFTAGNAPQLTIPLYTATKERHDALNTWRKQYALDKETAENKEDDRIVYDMPAGRPDDAHTFKTNTSNLFAALKDYRPTALKPRIIRVEYAIGEDYPLQYAYFPVTPILDLAKVLKPARMMDGETAVSFSVELSTKRTAISQSKGKGYKGDYAIKTVYTDALTDPRPVLIVETDGDIKTTSRVEGTFYDPTENRHNAKIITWDFSRLTAKTAVHPDFLPVIAILTHLVNAYNTQPQPVAKTRKPRKTAAPQPVEIQPVVVEIQPETAVSQPVEIQPVVVEIQPETAVSQPAQPVKVKTRSTQKTAKTTRRPNLLNMPVWDRIAYICREDGLPETYVNSLKSRKYQSAAFA